MMAAASFLILTLHIILASGGIIGPPITWTNDPNLKLSNNSDGSQVRIIMSEALSSAFQVQQTQNNVSTTSTISPPTALCGFYCSTPSPCDSFYFAIVLLHCYDDSSTPLSFGPQVIWSANRDRPVKENATLAFSQDGNLLLKDSDGTLVWSSNTRSKSMVQMRLSSPGRLQLLDFQNVSIWDSFDYPTDTWLLGQTLSTGQQLSSRTSNKNLSTGQFYLRIVQNGWKAYMNSDPPQLYYSQLYGGYRSDNITFVNGILMGSTSGFINLELSLISSLQFLRLESDGHLRHYVRDTDSWTMLEDVFYFGVDSICPYPTVCGAYGMCSNGQCSCPINATYFKPIDEKYLTQGCYPVTPISCTSNDSNHLISFDNASYFNYIYSDTAVVGITNQENCKQACLKNCSCKVALFRIWNNSSKGSCYLPSQLYSMMKYNLSGSGYKSFAYVKVQFENVDKFVKMHMKIGVIIGSVLGCILIGLLIGFIVCRMKKKFVLKMEKDVLKMEKENDLEEMSGLPARFTFEELKTVTDNFSKILGQGGFGSVFKGVMNGVNVAVKCSDNVGQATKQFLAEVKTIGSVHHIHLVRLIGFCSEKTCRMLVYEYMSNGSLDKWIFSKNNVVVLEWKTRVQIITEVAKALAYLHEECRQRIIHLDIKPQNILLDEGFHAKVSDFGLCKLIDRDQSHIMTTMRGTFGYLAPEWLTSKITEKADVYSFGVVVLEIVCGRRNLDYSQNEECEHLIALLKDKVKQCRISDILDNDNTDTQLYKEEMINMIKLAIWCLQNDYTTRPSMTTLVKVLNGSVELQTDININFTVTKLLVNAEGWGDSGAPPASFLSEGR